MNTVIDELISVMLVSNHKTSTILPWVVLWNNRKYQMTSIGQHHMIKEGRTLLHIFTVTDGTVVMKISFHTETLQWRLLEIFS